ncbi:hypothetical protein GTP55_08075 [Duganella sp. FT109W]|uniref:Lipoprotein n=1 Tax=Duganella margarita TaxID=2692170 RepID=A0ABW9WEC2_9BURK|nr:hypothetical protein [Duganella margarita]MYN39326.1 hypothetical protein [Duganella margarita]
MKNIVLTLFLAAGLAACNREEKPVEPPKPAAPVAPQLATAAKIDSAELMQAVFGAAYKTADKKAIATLAIDGGEMPHVMTAVANTQLPDGRVVLIVNGAVAADDGSNMASHADSGVLNVYLLQRAGDHWTVLQRQQNVAALGSEGFIGSVKWVMLAPGKPGFIVSNGGVWQGYAITHADIFELGANVRSLGGFNEASTNEGACGPAVDECWKVDGDISFAAETQQSGYNDIVVNFADKRYTVTEEKNGDFVEHVKSNTKASARYHFNGKEYDLVSGANPVPDI